MAYRKLLPFILLFVSCNVHNHRGHTTPLGIDSLGLNSIRYDTVGGKAFHKIINSEDSSILKNLKYIEATSDNLPFNPNAPIDDTLFSNRLLRYLKHYRMHRHSQKSVFYDMSYSRLGISQ